MKTHNFYYTLLLVLLYTICSAQELPIKPSRTISFTTDEGTYMNVDASPDGKTLVFDLLGDLYTVPVTGGQATQISRGMAINSYPVWSPDGKSIAYFSDATGSTHLHVRDLAGSYQRVLGLEDKQLELTAPYITHHPPVWSASGKQIAMGIWDYYSGEIQKGMVYNLSGDKLISDPLNGTHGNPIAFLKDGSASFYLSKGKLFRFDSITHEFTEWTTLPEKARSITISPDGKLLAYILDSDAGQSLVLQDVTRNDEKILVPHMIKEPYGYKAHVASRHFSFSPDSRYLYISYLGKIHRIDVNTGEDKIVPFTANVQADAGSLNYNTYRVNHDPFAVKYMRSAQSSPNGKQLVFAAMGKIYVMDLPDGKPRLLADQPFHQFQPAWSPDGKWVAYVSWSDTEGGFLWKVPAAGGKPEKIGKNSGHYYGTTWSPDGSLIATIMGVPEIDGNRDFHGWGKIQLIDSGTGILREIDEEVAINNKLSFSFDGHELNFQPKLKEKEGYSPMLVAMDLKSNVIRTLLTGTDGWFMEHGNIQSRSISPDRRYITYSASENLYLVPYLPSPNPQLIYKTNTLVSAIRFANGVDQYWEEGGKYLCWTYGNHYFRIDPDRIIAAAQQSPGMASAKYTPAVNITPDQTIEMKVNASSLYGKGTIVLKNTRLLTMKGEEVIEKGTVVIRDGRILELGPLDKVKLPEKAHVIDLKGATIMPGLVDLHLHMYVPNGVMAQQDWMFLAGLAYGITTASDPSQIYGSFGYGEMLRSGQMIGPRLYGSGQAIKEDALSFLNNPEEAKQLAEKRATVNGILMKQYMLPTRIERQRMLMACREAGVNMTNEGGFDPILHVGMIKDGSTGIEHTTYLGDVYKDQILLRAKSGTYWDPTLQCYKAQDYLNWKYWKTATPKMKRFLPTWAINEITKAAPIDSLSPEFLAPARIVAQVRHEGGRVVLGSHGNNKGVGPHNELWALQAGGLTNMEALQAATILGAEALGLQQDLGSLEPGKIADLIVLNSNPLDDIHNSRDIRYVMKDGVLYDGETLDTLWPFKRKLPEWKLKVAAAPKSEKAIAQEDHQH